MRLPPSTPRMIFHSSLTWVGASKAYVPNTSQHTGNNMVSLELLSSCAILCVESLKQTEENYNGNGFTGKFSLGFRIRLELIDCRKHKAYEVTDLATLGPNFNIINQGIGAAFEVPFILLFLNHQFSYETQLELETVTAGSLVRRSLDSASQMMVLYNNGNESTISLTTIRRNGICRQTLMLKSGLVANLLKFRHHHWHHVFCPKVSNFFLFFHFLFTDNGF